MTRTVTHSALHVAHFGALPLIEVAKTRSFASMVFEMLSEKEPSEREKCLVEFIMGLTIDHGPETPSAVVVREAAESGAPIGSAVGAGIAAINFQHGGAQEALMPMLYRIQDGSISVREIVKQETEAGRRIPGFGHRIYTTDPRTTAIFENIREHSFDETYISIVESLQTEITSQLGKYLPINVDGAIASALCTLGFTPAAGTALFIIARSAGLCGQYLNVRQA